jgi:integrase
VNSVATIYKSTHKGKDGAILESKIWRINYTDEHGNRRSVAGYRDKGTTEQMARELERNVERIRAGLPPLPLTDAIKNDKYGAGHEQRRKPLSEPVAAYLADLVRNGTLAGSTHHKECKRILATLGKSCRWSCLADIRADGLTSFLARLAEHGRAPRTQNRYHETLRAFLNWCIDQGWLEENPITRLKMVKVGKAGRRRLRRSYTLDEWRRLIAAAPEPRRTVYLVASFSGLRRSELKRLQKSDCTPAVDRPRWHARAEITKNHQAINLPMLPECAAAIDVAWNAAPSPGSLLFRDRQGRSAVPHVNTLHEDMVAAGISRQDGQGRWADFHSFRYFFCTMLANLLPIQKVKLLMRHSTIKLTADLYCDLGLEDVAEQVWTLPSLFGSNGTLAGTPISTPINT